MADLPPVPPAQFGASTDVTGRDVRLAALPATSVISVRARDEALTRVADALSIPSLPGPNNVATTVLGDCLWVRPDEWLVVGGTETRAAALEQLAQAVGPADGAVVDISASRVLFELSGARARDVLASCCPLDLHPSAFAVGQCAQSVVGKAPILLQLADDAPRWRVMVRPSLAGYVTSWLTDAMRAG